MKMIPLIEEIQYDTAGMQLESIVDANTKDKFLCMKGIFLQAELKNHNGRIYPRSEIERAVASLNDRIRINGSIPGECAHPDGLEINIDRISHTITDMWMEGNNGMGKLKILPTPLGNTIKVLLESGVKLGVSSRGHGDLNSDGTVKDFEIVTIDIVSQPSAPHAYPQTIYEKVMHASNKKEMLMLAEAVNHDWKAQNFFKKEVLSFFSELK